MNRYRIYVPQKPMPGEALPVMLYLHGSEERGTDNEGQLSGPAASITSTPKNFPFVIVFPQCPSGRFWDAEMINLANAELDQTIRELGLDNSRIYLAGFSLGGYGVWSAAAMSPTKFAAIVPMSGRLLPRPAERSAVSPNVLALADEVDPFRAFASTLKDVPIWIFHGAQDPVVPVSNSRNMAKALSDVGNRNFTYTELPATGHVSLPEAFSDAELFRWLALQKSRPFAAPK